MPNMTASITRCFASRPERLLRWLLRRELRDMRERYGVEFD